MRQTLRTLRTGAIGSAFGGRSTRMPVPSCNVRIVALGGIGAMIRFPLNKREAKNAMAPIRRPADGTSGRRTGSEIVQMVNAPMRGKIPQTLAVGGEVAAKQSAL